MSISFIDRNNDLDACLSRLQQVEEIALDLEFDKNLHRYGFNLCLMQIYDGNNAYLIDPLSDEIDITRIFPILEDSRIQKVVFAFGEDMRLLHSLDCFPKNIYDLDIATSLLNYPPGSLSKLVADVLDVDTGHSSQQSNWYHRPLRKEQIEYAAQDVMHLIRIKHILEEQAEQKNISGWIAEENAAFDSVNYAEDQSQTTVNKKEKKHFNEYDWHIYKKLMEFREELAKEHDKPSFKIIKKEYLADLARDPEKLDQWNRRRGIYRTVKTPETRSAIDDLIKRSEKTAQEKGLSQSKNARKSMSSEQYQAMKAMQRKVSRMKSDYFGPIKKRIAEDYGQVAASFMLSNRIVSELITNEDHKLENYKRKLITHYADELDLDAATIFNAVE